VKKLVALAIVFAVLAGGMVGCGDNKGVTTKTTTTSAKPG
jgi:hypothetical protein